MSFPPVYFLIKESLEMCSCTVLLGNNLLLLQGKMCITVLLLAALVSTAYTCTQTITNGSTAKTMLCSECNGQDDLCDLRIDQVTFLGTHNSGSGFDGLLYYYIGTAVGSCFYIATRERVSLTNCRLVYALLT